MLFSSKNNPVWLLALALTLTQTQTLQTAYKSDNIVKHPPRNTEGRVNQQKHCAFAFQNVGLILKKMQKKLKIGSKTPETFIWECFAFCLNKSTRSKLIWLFPKSEIQSKKVNFTRQKKYFAPKNENTRRQAYNLLGSFPVTHWKRNFKQLS